MEDVGKADEDDERVGVEREGYIPPKGLSGVAAVVSFAPITSSSVKSNDDGVNWSTLIEGWEYILML